jgi:hypothetical protein
MKQKTQDCEQRLEDLKTWCTQTLKDSEGRISKDQQQLIEMVK